MATKIQVQCIRKRDRHNPHERIEGIGGRNTDGTPWYLPEDQAIAGLGNKWDFYVSRGGHTVSVIIASHNGRPYLKTEADDYAPDNLLSLPECPR